MAENILEFRNITKRYPGVIALKDVSLSLNSGEIVALLGENGAGKSTFVKILCGVIPHGEFSGEILHNGKPVKYAGPKDSVKDGIAMIPQEISVQPDLTIAENIMMGYWPMKGPFVDFRRMNEIAAEALKKLDFTIDVTQKAGLVTSGIHQMMTIARALMFKPSVLILDEPTSALTENETETLLRMIGTLRDNGLCCLYITHKLDEVFKIADRTIVFRDGKLISEYERGQMSHKSIVEDIVGVRQGNAFRRESHSTDEIALSFRDFSISQQYARNRLLLSNVSFDLRKGEILGIAGLLGSGRSELLKSAFGAMPKVAGELYMDGRKLEIRSPKDAIENGIGLLTESRGFDGYVKTMSIGENMSLVILRKLRKNLFLDTAKEASLIDKYFRYIHIKAPSIKTPILSLSGGNQQKVLVAKWLMNDSKVLFLDEPTRGVDVGAREEIYSLMSDLTSKGTSIIMVSSELPELVKVCDRFVILADGGVSEILDTADGPVTEAEIMMRINSAVEKAN